MKNEKTILIADADSDFCSYLVKELDSQPDMNVLGVSNDGLDAIQQVETLDPDVLLMDILLPKLDGIGILRSLNQKTLRHKPMVVVMSYFATAILEAHTASLGAYYYLVKPFEVDNMLEVLRYQTKSTPDDQISNDVIVKITETLREMGVPSHVMGFHYVREAIILTLSAPDFNYGTTKYIYPQIAEKFSTTPSRVERAIRHAIEIAWSRGDIDAHYGLFRNTVSGERGKPTNSEFIATLADNILMQRKSSHSNPILH